MSIASSIFTITTMSLDRYMSIARPFSCARWFNKKTTVIAVIFIWLVAFLLSIPAVLSHEFEYDDVVNESFCYENWSSMVPGSRQAMGIIWFVSFFAIPGKYRKENDQKSISLI